MVKSRFESLDDGIWGLARRFSPAHSIAAAAAAVAAAAAAHKVKNGMILSPAAQRDGFLWCSGLATAGGQLGWGMLLLLQKK